MINILYKKLINKEDKIVNTIYKKCVANFEALHLSFKKKLNNKKLNISSYYENDSKYNNKT